MPDIPEKINLSDVNSRQVDSELLNELRDLFVKAEEQKERYDFTWNGKAKAYFEAAAPTTKTLRAQPKESVNFEKSENLFITGDNLEALKLLQESYLGKIDMIYIDPPYNTGADFIYHDNFKMTKKDSDVAEGNLDEEGVRIVKNEKSNGRYHSDWLTMMYPRLKLARNLLSDNGVIFVSIDDHEQANLKSLMDEIFGHSNYSGTYIWKRTDTPANLSKTIKQSTEYIITYKKTANNLKFNGVKKYSASNNGLMNQTNSFHTLIFPANKVDTNLPDGVYEAGEYGTKSYKINLLENTKVYDHLFVEPVILEGRFKWNQSNLDNEINNGTVVSIKTKAFSPSYEKKEYDAETPPSLIDREVGVGTNDTAQDYLNQLMGDRQVFDYPKPTSLIMYLFNFLDNPNGVFLDFFAGSGTTADAVMRLNTEYGGNRKFIVTTLDEETPEDSEARKAGYVTIDQISRERIRRAAGKIGDLSGFRALKVDSTGLKENVFKTAGELDQVDLLQDIDNHSDNRSDYDLLYDVLVDGALEYNRPITIDTMNNEKIIKYDYLGELSGVVCYFGENLTDELTRQIATLKPLLAVFKESTFDKSAQKVNVMEQFRIISPDTKVKVI
ncbi:site-specific DNA-methyltransferase [Vagococcus fluvialis]|uniref:site-specific DNA-methyltransferase n=1 Tax=Vagococcus fluvialis TaxID=2738 RepID=UPI003B5B26F1